MADPPAVEERISLLREIAPGSSHALHLHDTRGLGLVNALRALQLGITRFDTAIGGMGGCPFHPAAAGNIPTEDTAFLCSRLGAATGVDLSRLIRVTHDLEALYARELPAKIRSASLFSCGEAPSCSAGAAE
jgi:hydroxymethylglutaryl-CoA lyase